MLALTNGWEKILADEIAKPYFTELISEVERQYATVTVYPPKDKLFSAFNAVSYDEVKVVILGQDPYHEHGQANGMAFAVNSGVKLPPSLVNIFTEVSSDIGSPLSGSTLVGWAKQGVLLLNNVLSVRDGEANSHSALGWQRFTSAVVSKLVARSKPMVFMLWGKPALTKAGLIAPHHLTLTAPHPSPLAAYRGFFGCKHFSAANEFLVSVGQTPIDWTRVDE